MNALAHSAIGNTITNNTITSDVYVNIYRNIIGKVYKLYRERYYYAKKILLILN